MVLYTLNQIQVSNYRTITKIRFLGENFVLILGNVVSEMSEFKDDSVSYQQ